MEEEAQGKVQEVQAEEIVLSRKHRHSFIFIEASAIDFRSERTDLDGSLDIHMNLNCISILFISF